MPALLRLLQRSHMLKPFSGREDKSKLPEEQRTRFKWWFENLSRDLTAWCITVNCVD